MKRLPLLLALIAPTVACAGAEPPPVERDPTQAAVPAVAEAPAETPDFVAVISSRKTEVVPAAYQGRVKRVDVHQGQRVHTGDQIARLDDTELKNQIRSSVAEEKAARAQGGIGGANAGAACKAAKSEAMLYAQGVSSRQMVNNQIAQCKAAQAQGGAGAASAEAVREKRKILEDQLAKTDLKSPMDGVVMMVKAKEGEVVQLGQSLARVFDPSDLIVRFAVPREYRDRFKVGSRVEVHLDGVEKPIWALVENTSNEEPPINFTVVVADIDDSKLRPDEITVASMGRVRLADATPTSKRGANTK
jgi:RND family efflux transporter MFP subunit